VSIKTEEFIKKLRERDEDAYHQLIKTNKNRIYSVCFGILRNKEDAEEIAMDVFMKVFDSIHDFKSQSSLYTWMHRIAITTSLDLVRKRKTKKNFYNFIEKVHLDKVIHSLKIKEEQTDSYLLKDEKEKIVHRALSILPESQRVALTLNKIKGIDQKEISEIMGISVTNVQTIIYRAKRNLKKHIKTIYKKKGISL